MPLYINLSSLYVLSWENQYYILIWPIQSESLPTTLKVLNMKSYTYLENYHSKIRWSQNSFWKPHKRQTDFAENPHWTSLSRVTKPTCLELKFVNHTRETNSLLYKQAKISSYPLPNIQYFPGWNKTKKSDLDRSVRAYNRCLIVICSKSLS